MIINMNGDLHSHFIKATNGEKALCNTILKIYAVKFKVK